MFLSDEQSRAVDNGYMPHSNAVRLVETLLAQNANSGIDPEKFLPSEVRHTAYQLADQIEAMVLRDGRLVEDSVLELIASLGLSLDRTYGGGFSVTLHQYSGERNRDNPTSLKFWFVPQGETMPAHEHASGGHLGFAPEIMASLHGSLSFSDHSVLDEQNPLRLRPGCWVDTHKPQSEPWAGLVFESGVTAAPQDEFEGVTGPTWFSV